MFCVLYIHDHKQLDPAHVLGSFDLFGALSYYTTGIQLSENYRLHQVGKSTSVPQIDAGQPP